MKLIGTSHIIVLAAVLVTLGVAAPLVYQNFMTDQVPVVMASLPWDGPEQRDDIPDGHGISHESWVRYSVFNNYGVYSTIAYPVQYGCRRP